MVNFLVNAGLLGYTDWNISVCSLGFINKDENDMGSNCTHQKNYSLILWTVKV